jgi:hypothetical protein
VIWAAQVFAWGRILTSEHMTTIYVDLTRRFNQGRTRCILSSGQAVVLHRLAVMSKDGDWIVREDAEALVHILRVLEGFAGRYRWGAPLDTHWLARDACGERPGGVAV